MTTIAPSTPSRARSYARILVAVDRSPASKHVLAWARELAAMDGAEVVVASIVVPPYVEGTGTLVGGGWAYASALDAERARVADLVEEATAELAREGIQARAAVVVGTPGERIASLAKRERADLVIVGSHGRGALGRLLLGSVADAVKTQASCDVLLARTEPRAGDVLAAVDGSRPSAIAAATASRLAAAWHARLTVLHVVEPVAASVPPGDAFAVPPGPNAVTYVTSTGSPAERIVAHAREHRVGLVAMGSRGLGNVAGALVGSVSNRVAHEASSSVLLVKEEKP